MTDWRFDVDAGDQRLAPGCCMYAEMGALPHRMRGRLRRLSCGSVAFACILFASSALAQTLPLPGRLIDARSEAGNALLAEARARGTYMAMMSVFETQKNQAYCGIASMAMVLNAAQVPAPTTAEYQPYTVFTQDNVLNEKTEAILPRADINTFGTTLDQLGRMLAQYLVNTEVHQAMAGGLDTFRRQASSYLTKNNHFVIVNFLRRSIGEEAGGHISPLAAYDAKSDRFLLLDVARYKYPPVWVKTADLFAAMATPDLTSKKNRGYVLVTRRPDEALLLHRASGSGVRSGKQAQPFARGEPIAPTGTRRAAIAMLYVPDTRNSETRTTPVEE